MSTPSISVVIPTYKRRHLLPEVLAAIGADRYAKEIIVIVDGYDDGSLEYARSVAATDPRFRPIWQENCGESIGRQNGAIAATGEIVLFMDDDVVAGPGLAAGHARRHGDANDLVVVGYMPTKRPAPGERSADSFTTDLYADEYERTCDRYRADPDGILRGLWAGNISMRRDNALRIGLDPGYRLAFHEDQEFGIRCQEGGLRGVFDDSLTSTHLHSRGRQAFLRQAYDAGVSRRIIEAKHPSHALRLDPTLTLPAPVQTFVRAAGAPHAGAGIRTALRSAASATGRVRWTSAQIAVDRLLRQVELSRGYRSPVVGQ